MSEKSTLVEKLPPIAKAEHSVQKPTKDTSSNQAIAKGVDSKAAKTSTSVDPKVDDVAVATTTTEPPELTATVLQATALQHTTYYSFLGDALIWGLIGVFLFGKAFKDKAKVQFVAMATYGSILVLLGLVYFVYSKTFAAYLFGNVAEPTLALRSFGWAIAAPALFYVISRMIKVPSQDKKLYLAMFGLGAGLFLFIGLSQLMTNRLESAGLAIFPILFAASLTYLLFMTLGKGAHLLRGNVKRGVSIIVYAITAAWITYPIVNLISCFSANLTIFNLLLNLVDLALLGSITFGLWGSIASSHERIAFTQSFGKVKRSSAAPFKEPELTVTRIDEDDDLTAKAKPAFKRPQRPNEMSNN